MADIFISYAHEDRERGKALAQALAEQGWSVWWDRHIPSGQRFHNVIERELTAARCVIALWSTAALKSPWVREEAQDGLDREILVPARIETVRLPIGFRTVQTADLSDWKGKPAHPGFVQLIEDTTTVLGECPKQEALEPKAKPEKPVEPKSKRVPVADDILTALATYAKAMIKAYHYDPISDWKAKHPMALKAYALILCALGIAYLIALMTHVVK